MRSIQRRSRTKRNLVAWLFVAAAPVVAQLPGPLFVPEGDFPPGRRVRLAFDFDVDGDRDVLDDVGVLLNDGAGGFTIGPPNLAVPTVPTGASWQHTVAGDFDGDALPDVCFVTGSTAFVASVTFARNSAAAALVPQAAAGVVGLPTGYGVRRLLVADFDQDGRDDLLFAPDAPSSWSLPTYGALPTLLLCTGAFSFTPAGPSFLAAVLPYPHVLAVEDFDGDGDPDVLSESSSAPSAVGGTTLAVAVNAGGSFTPGPTTLLSSTWRAVDATTYADADGDGVKDLILDVWWALNAFAPFSEIAFLAGVPGGSFLAPVFTTLVPVERARAAAAVDAAIDPGVEYARRTDAAWTVYDFAAGAATPVQTIPASNAAVFGAGPQILGTGGDFDADGDRDLVVVPPNGVPSTYRADGSGALVRSPLRFPEEATFEKNAIVFDADGDGATDVVAAWPAAPGSVVEVVRTARNDGFGSFVAGPPPTPTPASSAAFRYSRIVADFDADGDRDVFGYMGSAAASTIFRNDGPLGWTPVPAIGTPLAAADFNGDGLPDLAYVGISAFFSVGVVVRFNLGGLAFGPEILLGQGGGAEDLEAADLDADGDVDLICVGWAGNPNVIGAPFPNAIFLNNGAGAFTVASVGPGVSWTRWVTTGDLNADGINDLVVGGQVIFGGAGWAVYGPGMATFPNVYATAAGPGNAPEHLVDLDGDGLLDLLGGAYWRRGLGGGFFNPPEVFAPQRIVNGLLASHGFPNGVAQVGDLDRDGDLDLVDEDRVVYLNRRRHLRPGLPPRLGRVATLEVAGPAFAPFGLWVAAGRAPTPINFGPLGFGFLDPASVLYFGAFGLDANGRATIPLGVPNIPALVGFPLAWEAGFPADARLSGLAETPIVGF